MQNVQNDVFYLKEAFKKLSTLNEESFNLTADVDVVDELQSFVADDIEAPYEEDIIDVNADTISELQDSYEGKVVLQCKCCNSRVYKEPSEVIIDSELDLANVEEECPVCKNQFGWVVLGKIEPYNDDAFDEKEDEEEVVVDSEISDDDIGEALKESLKEDVDIHVENNEEGEAVVTVEKDVEDTVTVEDNSEEELIDEKCGKLDEGTINDYGILGYRGIDKDFGIKIGFDDIWTIVMGLFSNVYTPAKSNLKAKKFNFNDFLNDTFYGDTSNIKLIETINHNGYNIYVIDEIDEDESGNYEFFVLNEKDEYESNPTLADAKNFIDVSRAYVNNKYYSSDPRKFYDNLKNNSKEIFSSGVNEEVDINIDNDANGNIVADIETDEGERVDVIAKDEDNVVEESVSNQDDLNSAVYDALNDVAYEFEVNRQENLTKSDMRKAVDNFNNKFFAVEDDEDLNEEFLNAEEVNIDDKDAADDSVKIENSNEEPIIDELNSVDIINESKSIKEDIENLSLDTDTTHMEMTSDENGKVTVVTEPRHEEEVDEVVDSEDEMIVPLTDEEIVDIESNNEVGENEFDEIDEFDEESFDELGESFLRRVYENVKSFKTTDVKSKGGKLFIEGLITFKSGKEKSTLFEFVDRRNTKRNKVIISGLNEMFSNNKRAFMLKGTLNNKYFISESLVYKYNVKNINESNNEEVVNVYGKAVVRK